MQAYAYIFILAGAALWGLIGIFVQKLSSLGFTPFQIVAIRVITAAVILVVYTVWKNSALLKIKAKDSKYFIGTGIISVVFFNWCYFTAIEETSLSVAAILLYTGPAFVVLLSRFFFQESLTSRKLLSLGLTLVGCALVVGLIPGGGHKVSTYGILVGLGSGLGYALYSIFGKFALGTYQSLTITTYTFVFASAVMLPASQLWNSLNLLLNWEVLWYGLGLGFFPTVLAYLLYTFGLSLVESSKASITATVEPIVAALVGIFVFGEVLHSWQTAGIMLILASIFLIQKSSQVSDLDTMQEQQKIQA
ncbi:DMT family transporter [Ammoniphilus sp. CFH 90114]|uniref:DMT family transporter n=1 Tax=Ammoniphilus sp. CFH 90114 TaxID=2493665 RepID=UPI00100EC8AD|nr:EamA family transporter [Ammoniphilus sp. CFH 90114]RXT15334.1 EamA family transporter [Ammoniphilus sp. CFH 90114]